MPVAATPVSTSMTQATSSTRWIQLVLGLIAMMSISSPQYVWTLFTKSFQDNLHTNLPAIQITFSIVIVLQTWLSPLQGYLVDKFGARLLIAIGCLLSGLGWVTSAYVSSLAGLYFTYGLFCGVGTGIVYIGIIGLMVRWFPDRRGFATGMVAAGYGFGAIATTFPIDTMLKSRRLSAHAGGVRHHSGHCRCCRGSFPAHAGSGRCPSAGAGHGQFRGRCPESDAA